MQRELVNKRVIKQACDRSLPLVSFCNIVICICILQHVHSKMGLSSVKFVNMKDRTKGADRKIQPQMA